MYEISYRIGQAMAPIILILVILIIVKAVRKKSSDAGSPPGVTPAGWYQDPEAPGQMRYWDGAQWTDHRAPGQPG